MKRFFTKIIMASLLLMAGVVFGQIPNTLSYQGILSDSLGNPVADGQYNMLFSIYNQANGGSSLWDEPQDVNVENGVFNVLLGKTAALDLPFDQPYWLETQVASDVLSPRSPLIANAYSLHAAGISDSIVTAGKIADGHVVRSLNGLKEFAFLSPGSNIGIVVEPNGFSLFASNDNPWIRRQPDIFFHNGNVGIGTDNPREQLEITGNFRLPATTATGDTGVIQSTNRRLIHHYGSNNFFAGTDAGNFTMADNAAHNTGIGYAALQSNSFGISNTAVGAQALRNNTGGQYNVAMGVEALAVNSHGAVNTAIGRGTLEINTDGDYNVAAGYEALPQNTTQSSNTAIGQAALQINANGNDNTALGYAANVAGANRVNATAIGYTALADASNKIQLGNDSIAVVETGGTIIAGSFAGPSGVSEMVKISTGAASAEAGDVLVMDLSNPVSVVKSAKVRAASVIGIYNKQPGYAGSSMRGWHKADIHETGNYTFSELAERFDEVPLAVAGIVDCKVSAENGPIHPGDLLVTASIPGYAMRDDNPPNGTLLGKALGNLTGGTGMMKILVTLQ